MSDLEILGVPQPRNLQIQAEFNFYHLPGKFRATEPKKF